MPKNKPVVTEDEEEIDVTLTADDTDDEEASADSPAEDITDDSDDDDTDSDAGKGDESTDDDGSTDDDTSDAPSAADFKLLDLPLSDVVFESIDRSKEEFTAEALSDLATSIKTRGLLDPIVVVADSAHKGKFKIVNGKRRFAIFRRNKAETIPAFLLPGKDDHYVADVVAANALAKQPNARVYGRIFRKLLEEKVYPSQVAIAKATGLSQSWISKLISALEVVGDSEEGGMSVDAAVKAKRAGARNPEEAKEITAAKAFFPLPKTAYVPREGQGKPLVRGWVSKTRLRLRVELLAKVVAEVGLVKAFKMEMEKIGIEGFLEMCKAARKHNFNPNGEPMPKTLLKKPGKVAPPVEEPAKTEDADSTPAVAPKRRGRPPKAKPVADKASAALDRVQDDDDVDE